MYQGVIFVTDAALGALALYSGAGLVAFGAYVLVKDTIGWDTVGRVVGAGAGDLARGVMSQSTLVGTVGYGGRWATY